ncbi:NACHT ankyrin domain-containing protein [Fusarium pseudoanthophilum]|uniref:NACHT ankyrin domain-containing protein n=1 Tax=Fusarium pseudoanthophilum TaxID=48495 RepID=A0A8H5KHX9_9HYPO|nr:NACHT ankyrin domain-containing protein [Fusarium pseudoanthophilum]
MQTKRPDSECNTEQGSLQHIHDIWANNGSTLFAGDVSQVNLSHSGHIAPTLEDAVKKCQDALFVSHPDIDRANIADTKGARAPGTCEWILENAECQAWLDKKSSLFWISGGPGTGKTVMSLFLSDQVEKRCQETDDHFLFYFCRFQHESYNKPHKLLRSLAYQLLNFSTDISKIHEVFTYLDTPEKAKNALCSLECLWKITNLLLSQSDLSTVYCLIDGIDECELSDVLIGKFRDYCTSPAGRKGPLKVALIGRDVYILGIPIHSRGSESSPSSIPGIESVKADASGVFYGVKLDLDHHERINDDIATFIRWSLEPLQRIQGFDAIRPQIEQDLLGRAEGTFLWVAFVVQELSKKRTCLQIAETVKDIPVGLYPIFGRMLNQIDPKYRHVTATILKWIAIAMRPLTLEELAYAIESDIEQMEDRISICQPLLRISDNQVLFVHQSAKDYLLRSQPDQDKVAEGFRIEEKRCHGEIAHRCLQIIEQSFFRHKRIDYETFESMKKDNKQPQIPGVSMRRKESLATCELFSYAERYWMSHARLSPEDANYLFDPSRPFFKRFSAVRRNWAAYRVKLSWFADMVAYLGLVSWLQVIREGKTHKSLSMLMTLQISPETPRTYNFNGDRVEAVEFILDRGVELEGEFSILWEAIRLGEDKLAQVIFEHGARIKDSSINKSVLISAVTEGFVGVVKLFVDHGADVNIRNSENETLLMVAARLGHKDLVHLLLDHGAHLSIADFRLWLDQATETLVLEWCSETVQAFLQRLTDICWTGKDGRRLLSLAAEWADHEIVQMCLAKGVDVNCIDPYGNTALIEAILGYRGQTPALSGWPQNGNLESVHEPISKTDRRAVVVALLDHGADPNIGGDFYDDLRVPPLLCAARQGLDWAVEELIGRGVDCNVRAEIVHRRGAIRRLLSSAFRGTRAMQECKNTMEEGSSALMFAARWGHLSTVRMLLAHGADISFVDEDGYTTLEWASESEHREIEQLLLEHDKTLGHP